MTQDLSGDQRAQLDRWLAASDVALQDARFEDLSEYTRCSAALDAGYYCALHLAGPDALLLDMDHPSERVLRRAAELSNVDVGPALLHIERRLSDPVSMPRIDELLAWAHAMRQRVPTERT